MQQRTCPSCGRDFTPTAPSQRFCPPTEADRKKKGQARSKCARRYSNHFHRFGCPPPLGHVVGEPFDCAWCDARCIPGDNVVAHATRFCSQAHKADWHRVHVEGLQTRRDARRTKARKKLARAQAGLQRTVVVWTAGPCICCGQLFVSQHRDTVTCSDRCTRDRKRAIKGGARKRARLHGGQYEPISPMQVFKRDHYRCQICHKPTARTKKVPHPNAPTVDHIIPLARGGDHLFTNVQCAHFLCNSSKGAQAADDQLRLVA